MKMKKIIFIIISLIISSACVYAGGFEIGAGSTVTLSGGELAITGDWTNNGSFVQTGGTVTFQGLNSTSTISGNTSFFNIACSTAPKGLKFQSGSIQTITGNLIMNGNSGNLIYLTSLVSGSTWYWNINQDKYISYVYVQDGNAFTSVVGSTFVVDCGTNSLDMGNNTRFIFGGASSPTWISPALVHSGYTLDTTPKIWFLTPSRYNLVFSSAQIVFAKDSGFTVEVSTFTYPDVTAGWTGMPAGPISISTYTVQTALDKDTTYYVKLRFYDGRYWTNWASTLTVNVSTTAWIDTITASTTPIRAIHFTELKNVVTNLRLFRGLGLGSWSSFDTEVVAGSPIRKDHLDSLRSNITDVYINEGDTAPTFTDPAITVSSTPIRAVHITELRDKCVTP
jgi:hypothetical protein